MGLAYADGFCSGDAGEHDLGGGAGEGVGVGEVEDLLEERTLVGGVGVDGGAG